MMQTLLGFFVVHVHENAFLKLDYLVCIVLDCNEPQEVFKYMEYLNIFSIIII